LKEYGELQSCDSYVRMYIYNVTSPPEGNPANIQKVNERFLEYTILYCLRAQQLRKADPPKFYEDPEPR
jgi:hypothetical protein